MYANRKCNIEAVQLKYAEAHSKIRDAINSTNVDEGSIPQFLNLINDGLIVGTLNDTAKREELNAKLGTFAELIERRTNTSLAIDTFFNEIRTKQTKGGPIYQKLRKLCFREIAEGPKGWVTKNDGDDEVPLETFFKGRLKPFVKYLADADYDAMDVVLCDDEDEFEQILDIIEAGIAKDKGRPLKRGTSGKETSVMRTLKQNEKDALLKQKQEPGKPKTAINAIRTKQTKGGTIYQKLRKLCLREIAEGPRGWVTKNDGDEDVDVYYIFNGRLKPFAKYLADEAYETMDMVLCDDEYDFEQILDIIEAGIAKDKGRPLKRGTSGKTLADTLELFITYLKDEQYDTMDSLLCDDEKEFNELVVIIENGIAKTNAANEESRKKKDTLKNDVDANRKAIDIEPIRTKQKKGGPLFEELKKLCISDVAYSKTGWAGKLGEDADLELPLANYFKGKLAKWADYLNEEGYESMNMIICDDDDEFEAVLDVIEEGIALDRGEPMKRGTSGSITHVLRKLKSLCMRKCAEGPRGWMEQQRAKKEIVSGQLTEVSPRLATFFGKMHVAVTNARKVLEYNDAQQSAIKNAEANQKRLKAIQLKSRKEKRSDVLSEFNKSRDRVLAQNPDGLNDGQAFALDVTRKENAALMTDVIVKLHVVDDLAKIFDQCWNRPITRETGLTLARDVESCSLQIMQSQATIRSFLLIARQLVEFKPAKPGPLAAPFWKVIDAGIITIFNSYIEMTKTSDTYFSFFAKFKSALQHFEAFREIQGDCIDVLAASMYLKRELNAFAACGTKMKVAVDRLRDDAIAVISDCVSQTSGARSFILAQKARKETAGELCGSYYS